MVNGFERIVIDVPDLEAAREAYPADAHRKEAHGSRLRSRWNLHLGKLE